MLFECASDAYSFEAPSGCPLATGAASAQILLFFVLQVGVSVQGYLTTCL